MAALSPPERVKCRNLGADWILDSAEKAEAHSPYDGQVFSEVPLSRGSDIDQVVSGASKVAKNWGETPIKERTQLMYAFRQKMLDRLEEVAKTVAWESGKTLGEAKAGVLKGLEVTEFALSLQNVPLGSSLEVSRGVRCTSIREPLGVVAGITPFNFPAMVPMWMFPIAITLGNCFVLKPSEKVAATAQLMGEIMLDSGFPSGVFNIVNGDAATVAELIDHTDIQGIAFVGSTPVARLIYQRAANLGKRALCLGGAKNRLIVVPDADPKIAVPGIVSSFTGCAGQRCMAASLLIAVGDVDSILTKVSEQAQTMELGKDMGAIIDDGALSRIHSYLDRAEKEGAAITLDGRNQLPKDSNYAGGQWIGPSIIDQADIQMSPATDEIFGPVLTIIRVDTLEEAMAIEAQTQFGNATSVFTTSGSVADYVASRSGAGMIGVNIGVPVPREPFSFGGSRESKFGAGDITGYSGVEFWTKIKKVTKKWDLQTDQTWMS